MIVKGREANARRSFGTSAIIGVNVSALRLRHVTHLVWIVLSVDLLYNGKRLLYQGSQVFDALMGMFLMEIFQKQSTFLSTEKEFLHAVFTTMRYFYYTSRK